MPLIVVYILIFFSGTIIGSFLNVCIYRIPKGLSILNPPSHCTSCGQAVKYYDNIPVISYILLRGRCRYCKTRFSYRYPFIETLNGILYVATVMRFDFIWLDIVYCLFISTMLVIIFVDLDHRIIPDVITLPGIPIALTIASFFLPDPFFRYNQLGIKGAVLGLFTGFFLFYSIAVLGRFILKKEAMGGGDIKMMAMIGAFIGWKGVLLTTFSASFFGAVIGIIDILLRGREKAGTIPFGSFLAPGAILSLFFGEEILQFYRELMNY